MSHTLQWNEIAFVDSQGTECAWIARRYSDNQCTPETDEGGLFWINNDSYSPVDGALYDFSLNQSSKSNLHSFCGWGRNNSVSK